MTAQKETAPKAEDQEGAASERYSFEMSDQEDKREPEFFQAATRAEVLDELIEASRDCERHIARRQLMQRRLTLNLIIYRDQLEEFGRAVWRGAE